MATQLKTETVLVLGVALGVIFLAYQAKQKAGQLVDKALDATKYINPVSDQNLAYQGSSALARWLTGQEDGTLGTIAWDYVHKAEPAPDGNGLINYTPEQQARDAAATRQLEAGFHGM